LIILVLIVSTQINVSSNKCERPVTPPLLLNLLVRRRLGCVWLCQAWVSGGVLPVYCQSGSVSEEALGMQRVCVHTREVCIGMVKHPLWLLSTVKYGDIPEGDLDSCPFIFFFWRENNSY